MPVPVGRGGRGRQDAFDGDAVKILRRAATPAHRERRTVRPAMDWSAHHPHGRYVSARRQAVMPLRCCTSIRSLTAAEESARPTA